MRIPRPASPIFDLLAVLPRAGRGRVAALAALLLLRAAMTPASILATGALVGSVPGAASGGLSSPDGRRLVTALVVLACLYVVEHLAQPFSDALAWTIGRRLESASQRSLMQLALRPHGIEHLEDPAVLDRFSLATGKELATGPLYMAPIFLAATIFTWLVGLASGAVLFGFAWWAPPALIAGTFATRIWLNREIATLDRSHEGSAGELRRAGYFRDLSLTPGAAKESRVFGLGGWLVGRFAVQWALAMAPVWRQRKGNRAVMGWAIGALSAAFALVFGLVARDGARGAIDIGMVAISLQATLGMFALVPNDAEHMLKRQAAAFRHLRRLEADPPASQVTGGSATVPEDLPTRSIHLDRITFHYPDAQTPVFDDLDLEIHAGRSLAIVGENGAGKTTLVKLLARLYEPDGGRIVADGLDVSSLDPAAWRARMAVIFQDFVRWHLPARDNVGFGRLSLAGDEEVLARAADRAGATGVVAGLPSGWDTILARGYDGGAELSGGQWQRIALARALAAVEGGAKILVLDEPTASLDVRAEAELFDRFLDLTRGLTTILISHRFSSVRRADEICVLAGGRVVERGSHAELMALGGRYATMFDIQAARFREADPTNA